MGLASKKTSRAMQGSAVRHPQPGATAWPGPLRAIPVPAVVEAGHSTDDNQIMSTPITREELDAKLLANAAEVKLIAHEMRADIGDLRAENRAQFSVIEALFEKQAARAEAEAAKSEARFEALTARIDAEATNEARFAAVDAKLDAVEKSLEGKMEAMEGRLGGRIDALDGRIDGLEGRLGGRIDGLEGRIDGLEGKIDGQRATLVMLQWVVILVATLAGLELTYLQAKPIVSALTAISAVPFVPPG